MAVSALPASLGLGAHGLPATCSAPATGPKRAGTDCRRPGVPAGAKAGAPAGVGLAKPSPALASQPGPAAAPPPAGDPFNLVLISPELLGSVPPEELAGARVVVLDAAQEVMGQIGAALQAHPGTTVVRVISHGEPGALILAGQRLSPETLRLQSAAMAGWR